MRQRMLTQEKGFDEAAIDRGTGGAGGAEGGRGLVVDVKSLLVAEEGKREHRLGLLERREGEKGREGKGTEGMGR